MKINVLFILLSVTLIFSCQSKMNKEPIAKTGTDIKSLEKDSIQNYTVDIDTVHLVQGFDFPVGKPDGKGYYNAQKFEENGHLGDDWNGVGGGNTDLGDPITAISNGYVSFAEDIGGGWGKVIRIVHYIDEKKQVESLYGHCLEINVKKGDYVQKGDLIGTIGNNDGQYLAHLHLELRNVLGMPIGGGYATSKEGFLNPTTFIKNNRK